MVNQIDNERDLQNYLLSFTSKVETKSAEIKYERHPVSKPVWMSIRAEKQLVNDNVDSRSSSADTWFRHDTATLHAKFSALVSPGCSS